MRIGAFIAATSVAASFALAAAPTALADSTVTVMSRNIYLGADVGVGLALIPDMPAAAQSMWDQMRATDFSQRAPLLAAEFAEAKPAVIGIQEATTWECTPGLPSERTVVFDFLQTLLRATRAAGTEYVIATDGTHPALNPGYTIPPISRVTMVHDPEVFQPLFGASDAACGFTIGDALLVRADLASDVTASGTVEYAKQTTVVPILMEITRGYAWADITLSGVPTRVVTTHLESLTDPGAVPSSAIQAGQLVDDLAASTMPLIVMGDFNSDPRDPRNPGDNPGGQPEISTACPVAPDPTCSAYRRMLDAGFVNAGPDPVEAANLSWGASDLLAGPDLSRLPAAKAMGNDFGLTDRLDYVWLRNGVEPRSAQLVGANWPAARTWDCRTSAQAHNAAEAATALGVSEPTGGVCLASDHAGVIATVALPASKATDAPLLDHGVAGQSPWVLLLIGITVAVLIGSVIALVIALVIAGIIRLFRRRSA